MRNAVNHESQTYLKPVVPPASQGNNKRTAVSKAFLVMQTIMRLGPTTPQAIADETGLPRLAVYRTITELKSFGWVRCRLGDNAVQVSSKMDDLFSEAHIQVSDVETMAECAKEISKRWRLHCDVGIVSRPGVTEILESTDREHSGPFNREDLLSSFSIAALSTLDDDMLERHFDRQRQLAGDLAVADADISEARRLIRQAREKDNTAISTEEYAIARGFRLGKGDGYAIRLRPRSSHSTRMETLEEALETFTYNIQHAPQYVG